LILVIDNYDSFTYNLVQLLGKGTGEIEIRRNDQITPDEIGRLHPERILISPGPGRPEEAGVTLETIRLFGPRVPTLGVCLGHQAIGLAFGGEVTYAPTLMHGRTSLVRHRETPLFKNVTNPFVATRYHSLVVASDKLPAELEITATTDEGVIMGLRHRSYPIEGVQFHPESILTEEGEKIIRNWMEMSR
jgi:anthranilate synthase/aminodeoxychorismate synthase-like glutamine amidotransferase